MEKFKKILLGIQHTFTMFGATVLVPIILGFDIAVALFMAGCSTILFHFITKHKIPVFLGSSFAFITPILSASLVLSEKGITNPIPYVGGGLFVAGLIYVIFSIFIYLFGIEKVINLFPPVVTGPIILIIGLNLAPTAIEMASTNYYLAIVALLTVIIVSIYAKGFLKLLPIFIGLFVGYITAILTNNVDFTLIKEAAWFGLPNFQLAKFDLDIIFIIAPVAIATIVEHIGDIMAISETVGKDFIKKPGLHRTLLGDGLMTSLSGLFGGPANTTYSENTGVLALTKVFDTVIMKIAAVFAILLGIIPKLSAIIQTIPDAVIGGISIVLFGMISSVGINTLVKNKVNFDNSKNMIIVAVILVLGIGGASFPISLGYVDFKIESIALAAIIGIVLNKVLSKDLKTK